MSTELEETRPANEPPKTYDEDLGLVGKTIVQVFFVDNELNPLTDPQYADKVVFVYSDGTYSLFEHHQDCCETVQVEEVIGDIQDLIGSPLVMAEAATSDDSNEEEYESATWTFYRFQTVKGDVVIRWLGTSNGYYGEGVDHSTGKLTTFTGHNARAFLTQAHEALEGKHNAYAIGLDHEDALKDDAMRDRLAKARKAIESVGQPSSLGGWLITPEDALRVAEELCIRSTDTQSLHWVIQLYKAEQTWNNLLAISEENVSALTVEAFTLFLDRKGLK